MSAKILPKINLKGVRPTIRFQSSGIQYFFFLSGVLTCLYFFMNTRLIWDVYTLVPTLKNYSNDTRNMSVSGTATFSDIKETALKIIGKLTNVPFRNKRKIKEAGVFVNNCSDNFRHNHLLTIEIVGRTGNNLFQLAALIATAESTCYTAVRPSGMIRHINGIFDLQNVENRTFKKSSFRKLNEPGWSIYMNNMKSLILPEFNWTLMGYRQSYRYFQNYSKLIKPSFQFKENIKMDVIHYLENRTLVYQGFSVCMHVRRGDLVKRTTRDPSNLPYINRAISYFKKHLAPANFSLVVASGDMKWCTLNIKEDNTYFSPFKDAGRDLFLLTQCNHNIMTVGSFGWFGSWLNETGIVVYDKTFAHNQVGHNPKDYFPDHWIGL